MANGWINGLLGVLIFSGSLPATRLAVIELDPVFLTVARAAIAGLLAVLLLLAFKEKRPARSDLIPLIVVALGVVVGFPLLTALALQHVTSAHSIVFVGLLPLATAIFGVLRGGEQPRPAFWIFSLLGSSLVVGFALLQGLSASPLGDALMLASILVCGLGYAEGAKLSRSLGGDADLDQPRLRILVQHAYRFRVLVSRTGAGRYRCRGAIAVASTVLWSRFGGDATP